MKTLIVIDMQNDFVTGSLANPAAEAIIPFIKAECESGKYDKIIFTKDTHYDNYLETQEGKYLPVKHCIRRTVGWEVVPKLQGLSDNTLEKGQFGSTQWMAIAFTLNDEITLVGTCTDICVISNALILKAFFPETKINVLAKGCAGLTPEKHAAALEVMKSCQINVVED
jgi:nicotinamidase-related amidase